jgi:hypothetical protein
VDIKINFKKIKFYIYFFNIFLNKKYFFKKKPLNTLKKHPILSTQTPFSRILAPVKVFKTRKYTKPGLKLREREYGLYEVK